VILNLSSLEETTFYIIGWLFVWFMMTSRAFERVLLAFFENQIRWPVVVALVASLQPGW
jgi:hypothetical protein